MKTGRKQRALLSTLQTKGLSTVIEYGEAALWSKVDFMVKDALGRHVVITTRIITTERFDLTTKDLITNYIDL
jgi:threonyl-tRNA synthetase